MDDIDTGLDDYIEGQQMSTDTDPDKFDAPLYKKWFKTSSQSGFLSLSLWPEKGKLSVDIGETGPSGLIGNTKVWAPAIGLATYLDAVYDGVGAKLYPTKERIGIPTPEGIVIYGSGTTKEGKPLGRVLKIHHYDTYSEASKSFSYDSSSFVWKTGIFHGRVTSTGATIPDMSKPVSANRIKVSRSEMAEIRYRLNLALVSIAADRPRWWNDFASRKDD